MTTSRSISGTRRYFICIHDESEVVLTEAATTHGAASDVTLFDFPKAISVRVRLVYFAERDVHKVIAVDEMSVERLPIFELDQLSKVNERNFAKMSGKWRTMGLFCAALRRDNGNYEKP